MLHYLTGHYWHRAVNEAGSLVGGDNSFRGSCRVKGSDEILFQCLDHSTSECYWGDGTQITVGPINGVHIEDVEGAVESRQWKLDNLLTNDACYCGHPEKIEQQGTGDSGLVEWDITTPTTTGWCKRAPQNYVAISAYTHPSSLHEGRIYYKNIKVEKSLWTVDTGMYQRMDGGNNSYGNGYPDFTRDYLDSSYTGGAFRIPIVGSVLTYTPNQDWYGTDKFVFQANDGETDSKEEYITINVGPVNDPPTTSDKWVSTPESVLPYTDTQYLGITLPQAPDPEDDDSELIYKIVSNTQHGIIYEGAWGSPTNDISQQFFNGVSEVSLGINDKDLRYMPYAYYNGEDSFTFKACDPYGACSNISTVHIDVISHDNPTTTNENPIYTVLEDDQYNYIQLTGFDPDSSMDFVISNEPQNGSLIRTDEECLDAPIWVDGVFVGNCNPQFVTYQYIPNSNFYGTDTFSFYGVGSSDTDIKTVQIEVQQLNDPPEAKSFAVSTWEDKALEIYPMGSDTEGAFETGNLVQNNTFSEWPPGSETFENPPDGTEVADNWFMGVSSGINTTYQISRASGGIKLTRGPEPDNGSSYFHIKQEIPITHGKEYELEFWVYSNHSRVQFELNKVITSSAGQDLIEDIIPNQWNRMVFRGIADIDDNDTTQAVAFARASTSEQGDYWIINNISVRETKD